MKEVFRKRRSLFLGQCLKYLRYVLNDHFVLVLLFLSGFLMVQYGELLKHFPKRHWWLEAILIIVTVALLSLGKIATYIEKKKSFLGMVIFLGKLPLLMKLSVVNLF